MFSRVLFLWVIFCFVCGTGYAESKGWAPPPSYCLSNPNPCLSGGTCLDSGSSYRCACTPGCTGIHCEDCGSNTPTACSPNPCRGDCLCHESCQHSLGYYCRSAAGFLGKNCTIPVPELRCDRNRITLSVAESFVKEYDMGLRNSFLSVGPGSRATACKLRQAVGGRYEAVIPLPFTACGTQSSAIGLMTFANEVWFNRDLANSMFDMPIPAIKFRCQYDLQYDIVTSIRPVVPTPPSIEGRIRVVPSVSLCKVGSCPAECPTNFNVNGGAAYTVGELIHVRLSLDSGMDVVGLDYMYLSCSPTPSATNIVEVVRKGCGSSSGLPCRISHSASDHHVCVSFQTPRGLSCSDGVYIHARLTSCSRGSVQACQSDSRVLTCPINRKKRSVGADPVTIGPIFILEGAAGLGKMFIHGMEEAGEDAAQAVKTEAKHEVWSAIAPKGVRVVSVSEDEAPDGQPDAANTREGRANVAPGLRTPALALLVVAAVLLLIAVTFSVAYFRLRSFSPK